ncbi:hypothetical protein KIPB_014696, partial [Kipferlia bialata]
DTLDFANGVDDFSRLACCCEVSDGLAGATITVPQ